MISPKKQAELSNEMFLKPEWTRFPFGPLGLALVLSFILIFFRAFGILGSASFRWVLPLGFVIMMASPWIFLTQTGRRQIGLRPPKKASFLLTGLILGVLAAIICFLLGVWFYGDSSDNWFVSIANSYKKIQNTVGMSVLQLHLMFTIAACLFSPIGEEIFFRGFLQRVLGMHFNEIQSTNVEAGLFGFVHLLHHGLVFSAAGFALLPVTGAVWVFLMFSVAWMFAWLRKSSDSLFPAIVSHAAFNATMNTVIFAYLWH